METDDEDHKPASGAKRRSPDEELEENAKTLRGRMRALLPGELESERRTLMLEAIKAVGEDLDTIATNLDLVDDAEALRVSVRISRVISRKVADGAKIIIREKNGKASELVIEAMDEGR